MRTSEQGRAMEKVPSSGRLSVRPEDAFWQSSWIKLLAGIVTIGTVGLRAQEVVNTVAGQALHPGYRDGQSGGSRFNDPAGLATDSTASRQTLR